MQARKTIIVSLNMLLDLDSKFFFQILVQKAKEKDPQFKLTEQLYHQVFLLAEQFNRCELTPREFYQKVVALFKIKTLTEKYFWQLWKDIIKYKHLSEKLQLLKSLSLKHGFQIVFYLGTNVSHLSQLVLQCEKNGIKFNWKTSPPQIADLLLYTSCQLKRTRLALIECIVNHLYENTEGKSLELNLLHNNPETIQNLKRQMLAKKDYAALRTFAVNWGMTIYLHNHDLQETLHQVLSRRHSLQSKNLAKVAHFSIDLIVRNDYTHEVNITELPTQTCLQKLILDPDDHTLVGSISKHTLARLGEEAEPFLSTLTAVLTQEIGAKEFLMIPSEAELDGYGAPQDEHAGFKGFRHIARHALEGRCATILNAYSVLTAELDARYRFITYESSLVSGQISAERYQEIQSILMKACFTDGKAAEYPAEEVQGKMSRFKNEAVRPIVMLSRDERVMGLVRAVDMDNQFSYLSDAVMNQELLPFDRFQGQNEAEKTCEREIFLLAYLMYKACTLALSAQKYLFITVPAKSENVYEKVGFEPFPLNLKGWKPVIKCGPKGPSLVAAQAKLKALASQDTLDYWRYAKLVGAGALLMSAGLFAGYRLLKGQSSTSTLAPLTNAKRSF